MDEQLGSLDDSALVGRTRAGESAAFGVLYERHVDQVFRYLHRKTGGKQADAEDLTHQIFTTALVKLHDLREGTSFKSWIFSIAWSRFIDWTRRRVHAELVEDREAGQQDRGGTTPLDSPEDILIAQQDQELLAAEARRVRTYVEELLASPDRSTQRKGQLLYLRLFERLPYERIWEALGYPSAAACRKAFQRAHEELVAWLGGDKRVRSG